MGIREVVDWIQLAQAKVWCRTLMNKVIKL
jgi:hypothetical protein